MSRQLKAVKCPSDELSLTNCAIVNPREFENVRHIEITGPSQNYIFSVRVDNLIAPGEIGFSAVQVNISSLFITVVRFVDCLLAFCRENGLSSVSRAS